ncbi:DUF6076 domain-containing protein [Fundicoccus sp. Sow4_F4]|uniref:DUF6076 domain-containing protein n=1 Tax=Fundicoccus sp. Sow4_F4 TaxID=3438783 RepID=UPI003F8EDEFE
MLTSSRNRHFAHSNLALTDRTLVKKCRNCGRYFVVKNLNVEYCSRLIDPDEESLDNRTCSDVGPKRSYMKKLE